MIWILTEDLSQEKVCKIVFAIDFRKIPTIHIDFWYHRKRNQPYWSQFFIAIHFWKETPTIKRPSWRRMAKKHFGSSFNTRKNSKIQSLQFPPFLTKKNSNFITTLSYCSEIRRLEGWIGSLYQWCFCYTRGNVHPAPIGRHWANVLHQSTGKHTLKSVYPVLVTLVLLPAGS